MTKLLIDHVRVHRMLIMRFGVVGVAATIVHLSVALIAQSRLHHPLLANLIGFLVAFVISYLGHAMWSFKIATGWRRAAVRFFVVAGSGFLFSNLILTACVSSGLLPPAVALMVSIGVIPVCNYAAARLWAFAQPTHPGQRQS